VPKDGELVKKVLPIGQPLIMSYKNYCIPFAIMANVPESRSWILNRFLQLYTRSEIKDDYHWLQFYLIHDCLTDDYTPNPWLEIHMTDPAWFTKDSATTFIRTRIDEGRYVEVNCDQYYLSHTHAYAQRHRYSNLLIHGFDDKEQVYHVLDFTFTTTRQFQSMTIPYSSLILHIDDVPTRPLKVIKLREDAHTELHISLIHQLLSDYLHSHNTSTRLAMLPHTYEQAVFGLEVYTKFEEYIQALIAHQSYINILPFQILFDHKKCVYELVQLLHQANHFTNPSAGNQLVKDAESLMRTALAFRNTKLKFLRKQDKSIFGDMLNMIPEMKERDKLLCDAILSALRLDT